MQKQILMTALAVTILIACKKINSDPTPGSSVISCINLPDITTNGDGDTLSRYFYMQSTNTFKIGKIQNYDTDGMRDGFTQFVYDDENQRIFKTDYFQNGYTNGDASEYYFGMNGKIEMQTYYNTLASSHDTILFQYNVTGNNTYRIHQSVGTTTSKDTILNSYTGNTRIATLKIKNGQVVNRHDYIYTTNFDKIAFNEFLKIFNTQTGIPAKDLFGNLGENLIAKDTYTDNTDAYNNYVATYAYEFDSNGYPVKVTYDVVAASGGISFKDIATYKYECR